jgi:phosphoribosyl 1,2-cyclic phosphodiesterase
VSNVECVNIMPTVEFQVCALPVLPFAVMHGEDLESMGFLFGSSDKVCYISDISRMLPDSLQLIKRSGPIDVLIVDALLLSFNHPTHYSLEQAVELCKDVKPKRAFFVGMSSSMEHDEVNEYLKELSQKEGIEMQLAHDGLAIDIQL